MINLPEEKIKEIAEQLDCGFKCFVNKTNGVIISIPDEDRHYGIEMESWQEDIDKLDDNFSDYYEIDMMEPRESFAIMEDFTEELDNEKIKKKLFYALSRPKPFQNFKYEIDYYSDIREEWFAYKNMRMIEWVKEKIDYFNSRLEKDLGEVK